MTVSGWSAPKSACDHADCALPSHRSCSTSWATSSVLQWLCSSLWLFRWLGCASATAGASSGVGAACVPIGAHWVAGAAASSSASPSPPSSSCECPKALHHCPPSPQGGPCPWGQGWGCSVGPPHHCLLVPGRTSAICALVTNQRVKEQMEPGLGAVPDTLRTLRQHIDNVPQVGPQATLLSQGGADWEVR